VRRAARSLYWIGLFGVPFLGTVLLVGGTFAGMHALHVTFGILPFFLIGLGVLAWLSLIRVYRALVPCPCRKCGRAARATSLNPITIRCGLCGDVEVLDARILGAP
jgi:hypothetical protein